MGSLGLFLLRFLRAIFSIFSSVFSTNFSKEFLYQNSLSLFIFKVLKNQRKSSFWEFYFVLHIIYPLRSFYQVFSLLFNFQILCFLTYLSYQLKSSFRIFILWEKLFVIFQDHQERVCDLCDHQVYFIFCFVIGLVPTSCVEVCVEREELCTPGVEL